MTTPAMIPVEEEELELLEDDELLLLLLPPEELLLLDEKLDDELEEDDMAGNGLGWALAVIRVQRHLINEGCMMNGNRAFVRLENRLQISARLIIQYVVFGGLEPIFPVGFGLGHSSVRGTGIRLGRPGRAGRSLCRCRWVVFAGR